MRCKIGALLVFCIALVAGCGGGGNGDSSRIGLGSLSSKLFMADSGNSSIASTIDVDPPDRTLLVFDRVIDGAATNISNNVRSLAIDRAKGLLYVANGETILVFSNFGTANGNVSPARTISSSNGDFVNINSLYLNTANDVLYAGDLTKGVWIIHAASTRNGPLTPNRKLTRSFGAASFQIHDIFVDTTPTRDLLYVSRTTSASEILVFTDASSVDDTAAAVTPAGTISPSPSMTLGAIFADVGLNELYVSTGSNTIVVFASASSANGPTLASRIIGGLGASVDLVVDTGHDKLYTIDGLHVNIIYNAHLLDSISVTPTKKLTVPGGSSITALAINP